MVQRYKYRNTEMDHLFEMMTIDEVFDLMFYL